MAEEEMSTVGAIKKFFEANGGRKLDMKELQALNAEERADLGKQCKEALSNKSER